MLQTYNIDPAFGLRYTTPLGEPMLPFRLGREADEGKRRTVVAIKEDGRTLGPAGVPLDEIAVLGRGRNAHRDGVLHFSASDASDPRTNGRFYHVTYTLQLDRGCLWSLLSAGAVLSIAGLVALHEPGR